MVLPPQRTYIETTRRAKRIAAKIARGLKINGPFNIQFLARDNKVRVIECNLRASRSFPFASKIFRVNFIDLATRVIMNRPIGRVDTSVFELDYVGVKAPQFLFTRLDGADPVLGVEMASTGEVGCIGDDFEDAFLKALLSVGFRLPVSGILLSTGPVRYKAAFLASTRELVAEPSACATARWSRWRCGGGGSIEREVGVAVPAQICSVQLRERLDPVVSGTNMCRSAPRTAGSAPEPGSHLQTVDIPGRLARRGRTMRPPPGRLDDDARIRQGRAGARAVARRGDWRRRG